MRRHITRKSLAELARELQTLTPEEQERYYGGGDGSVSSPYTYKEYQLMSSSGTFLGGYVDVGGGESIFYAASKALDGGVASGDRVLDEVHVNASSGAIRDVFRDIL